MGKRQRPATVAGQKKAPQTDALSYPFFSFVLRAALLAMVWWIISGGAVNSWSVGFPLILIAAHLGVSLSHPGQRLHLLPLLSFIPFFLCESVRGGIDVARRAYSPSLPLTPAVLNYPLRLPVGAAQVFFANTVSLLPGTLSTGLEGYTLRIHVLDNTTPVISELKTLELKIAAIFGIDINNNEHSHEEHENEAL